MTESNRSLRGTAPGEWPPLKRVAEGRLGENLPNLILIGDPAFVPFPLAEGERRGQLQWRAKRP